MQSALLAPYFLVQHALLQFVGEYFEPFYLVLEFNDNKVKVRDIIIIFAHAVRFVLVSGELVLYYACACHPGLQ